MSKPQSRPESQPSLPERPASQPEHQGQNQTSTTGPRRLRDRVEQLMAPLYARLMAVLGLLLLPIVIYSIIAAYSAYREGRDQSIETMRQLGELAASQDQSLTDSAERLLMALTRADVVPNLLLQTKNCVARMAAIIEGFKTEYSYMGITDAAGNVLCSSRAEAVGLDLADRPWWQETRKSDEIIVSDLIESKLTGEPIVTVAAPLGDKKPAFGGVMFIGINANALMRQPGLPGDASAYLIDRSGHAMTMAGLVSLTGQSPESLKAHPALRGLPDSKQLAPALEESDLRQFAGRGLDGQQRIYVVTPLEGSRLLTLVGLPESRLLSSARQNLWRAVIVPVTMMIWALLLAALAGHFMVARSLRSLSRTARALRRGDYSARPPVRRGPQEMRQLAETLTALAERISQHEQSLSRSIEQKDAMLKEIHHRIKNNLQVVTSLMSLQAGRLRDPVAMAALADLQRRVRSLSLLHKHLYEGDDLRYLDFGQFVSELCQMVKESCGPAAQNIAISVDIPPIPLDPDRAVPVALLITEALSNALRHGFPAGARGKVTIGLTADADGKATITIADDGIGWVSTAGEEGAASERAQSMGMSLMQVFARQLGGELEVAGPPGAIIRFSFALA
jgi:two-component sensor histidine kinase